MSTVCLPNNVTCLSTRVKQMIMREFANNLIETDVSAEEAVINDTVYDKLAASIVVDSTKKKIYPTQSNNPNLIKQIN